MAKKLPKYVVEKNGRWTIRKTFPTTERDKNGRIKYVSIQRQCADNTEEAANETLRQLEAEYREAVSIETDSLEDYFKIYLESKKGAVSRKTYNLYVDYFDRLIKPFSLAQMPIEKINALHLQRHYGQLKKTPQTVHKLHKVLATALNQAVKWGLLMRSPTLGVVLPKITERREIRALDEKQIKKFVAECRKTDEHIYFEVAAETGARPQEYLALTWGQLKGLTLKIDQVVDFKIKGGGFSIDEDLKTKGSKRSITISPQLRERLMVQKGKVDARKAELKRIIRHDKDRRKHARAVLRLMNELDLMFPSANGTPLAAHNLNHRTFKDIIERIGLKRKDYSIYSLRHSSITLLLMAGVDVKTVAQRHGTSAEVIWRTYAHSLPAARQEAADKMAAAIY